MRREVVVEVLGQTSVVGVLVLLLGIGFGRGGVFSLVLSVVTCTYCR